MRLIDIEPYEKYGDSEIHWNFDELSRVSAIDTKNIPTVDAVPVVRCKDCKNWKVIKTLIGYDCVCTAQGDMNVSKFEDDFCSWGEKDGAE